MCAHTCPPGNYLTALCTCLQDPGVPGLCGHDCLWNFYSHSRHSGEHSLAFGHAQSLTWCFHILLNNCFGLPPDSHPLYWPQVWYWDPECGGHQLYLPNKYRVLCGPSDGKSFCLMPSPNVFVSSVCSSMESSGRSLSDDTANLQSKGFTFNEAYGKLLGTMMACCWVVVAIR